MNTILLYGLLAYFVINFLTGILHVIQGNVLTVQDLFVYAFFGTPILIFAIGVNIFDSIECMWYGDYNNSAFVAKFNQFMGKTLIDRRRK